VRLETAAGALEARAAIVTVSTTVLARGGIALPPAADEHAHAASQLPLGLADKLFLALDDPDEIDPESHLLGNPRRADTGSYYLRPFGRPVIECFFGGTGARALEGAGLDGMAAFAIDELAALFGSDFRKRVRAITASSWGVEDWIGGSYSQALPGCAGARAVLARPVDERLFFAGEACSAHDFSTAHGALETGAAAAEAVVAALSR
jgi:monoamine oxidase